MNEKRFAKRYIISLFALYFFGAVFLFLITLFLSNRNDVNNALSINQIIAVSLLFPLLPCASFAGFCMAFWRIKEFKAWQKIAICVFFPITLVLITLYGFVMLIPSVIKQFRAMYKIID